MRVRRHEFLGRVEFDLLDSLRSVEASADDLADEVGRPYNYVHKALRALLRKGLVDRRSELFRVVGKAPSTWHHVYFITPRGRDWHRWETAAGREPGVNLPHSWARQMARRKQR